MFDTIYRNADLYPLISSYCSENNVEVCLSEYLEENADDNILILSIDHYYNNLGLAKTPPSIDCLIIVKCENDDCYDLYLVELKDINSPGGFNNKNIKEKFVTTIEDFMSRRFSSIFLNNNFCKFKCYFVANPYNCSNTSDEEYTKKIHSEGLKLDYFNSLKPFQFNGKSCLIEPKLPNPLVSEC